MKNPETRNQHMNNKMESYVEYAQNQSNVPEEVIAKNSGKDLKTQAKASSSSGAPAHVVVPTPPAKKVTPMVEKQTEGFNRPSTKDRSGEKKGGKQTIKGKMGRGKSPGKSTNWQPENTEQEGKKLGVCPPNDPSEKHLQLDAISIGGER